MFLNIKRPTHDYNHVLCTHSGGYPFHECSNWPPPSYVVSPDHVHFSALKPTVGWQLADWSANNWPTVNRLSVDLSTDSRQTVSWLLVDCRLTYRPTVYWLSVSGAKGHMIQISSSTKFTEMMTRCMYLFMLAHSWFPLSRNTLSGYLILYANNRQMVSKDRFPLR